MRSLGPNCLQVSEFRAPTYCWQPLAAGPKSGMVHAKHGVSGGAWLIFEGAPQFRSAPFFSPSAGPAVGTNRSLPSQFVV